MTRGELIKRAKDIIAERKVTAEQIAQNNLNKALQNKEYKQIDSGIASLIIEIAKAEIEQKNTDLLESELKAKQKEQEKILKQLNLSLKDLESQYFCKKCNDSGVLNEKHCLCFEQVLNQEFLKVNKIENNTSQTFENSDASKISLETQDTYKKMQLWCERFPNVKTKNLILQGGTGIGKTYLVNAIANELTSKSFIVQNLTAFAFNNLVLKYHTCFDEGKEVYLENLLDCDLLIIDDLGTENIFKNVTKEYLYLVINERLLNNKQTIITTNMLPSEILDRYGERVFSRLMNKANSRMLKLTGTDNRLKK